MVWIVPGEFTMGDKDHKPGTKVAMSKGFWLGKYEVTQAQWKTVTGESIRDQLAKLTLEKPPQAGRFWLFNGEGRNHPVYRVTWAEASEFCRKLTQIERAEGRLPLDWEYTLPTEAQWEYSCRAGTTGDYAGDLDSMAWYERNAPYDTHPVGQKQPNAWGLYDMHGNVWEWCLNSYSNYPGGAVTDPVGATSGTVRIFRGGCWGISAASCRSAFRCWFDPALRDGNLGFRLALSPVR
jgi:formylglycine-generating enzyme required for sulfatase activity